MKERASSDACAAGPGEEGDVAEDGGDERGFEGDRECSLRDSGACFEVEHLEVVGELFDSCFDSDV